MRTFALAVVGLAAVSHALPTAGNVEERQTLSFPVTPGTPSLLDPTIGGLVPGNPSPETTFTVGRRDRIWIPTGGRTDKDDIEEAELELQEAQQDLREAHSRHERARIQRYIDSLERYLRVKAGITSISSPPGTTTTFTPGKRHEREEDDIPRLVATFIRLAGQYKDKHPSVTVYLILEQIRGILLGAHALPENVIFLGPATSTFEISSKEKRQIWIGGSCDSDEIITLLLTYASLQAISGGNPSPQLKSLENAVLASLRRCNADPTVGGITPDPTVPGSPIVPNKPTTGSPLVPNKPTTTGSPLVPSNPNQTGAPLVPSN